MGKRICETKGCINFKQHVGNPNGRHSAIQIQYECLGTIRHVCCQPVDPQRSIFYAALLQIVGGDKLIIPFADGAAHEPIQRPAFSA